MNHPMPQRPHSAFTLIELMVVISLIALLSGMMASLMGLSKRSSQKANTEIVMRKVSTALRLFQRDNGVLPYQVTYPSAVTAANPFSNGLARRLGHALTTAELIAFNQALVNGANKYSYWGNLVDSGSGSVEGNTPGGISFNTNLTYRENYLLLATEVQRPGDARAERHGYTMILNRAAADRARMAVFAGAVDLPGPYIVSPAGHGPGGGSPLDLTTTRLLETSEYGSGMVGWCDDYLEGSLTTREVIGDDVVDAWRRPLVYVCQALPRMRSNSAAVRNLMIKSQDLSWYGLGATGFKSGSGPWTQIIAKQRWRLLSNGRITVGGLCIDGLMANATGMEVLSTAPADSDRRYFSGMGFESDFELWSSGADGALAWSRSDPVNRDNVPLYDYDRGLK